MEDGPLPCAAGSGTDPTAPLSQVIDSSGMYYDPGRPSDLEAWLVNATFLDSDLARARALRKRLLQLSPGLYGMASSDRPLQMSALPNQRVILVPGQVPQDASVRLGCPDIASDAALLAAVRSANPHAHILYKPHPDVVSGNRSAGPVPPNPRDFDQRVDSANIVACLDAADEVHTMTSLVGFEAVLRGRRVVTYGLPFYAGWGLTEDRHTLARRNRRLSLDELVAGVLLHYPRYVNDLTGEFTTAEWAVERLAATAADASPLRRDVLHRWARTVRAFTAGVWGELRGMRMSPRSQRRRT
jgi:capsular polysaccharide export protein